MTFNNTALDSGLTSLFTDPPTTFSGCADQWAQAVYDYSVAVIPLSTTADVAKVALASSLASAFTSSTSASETADSMETAFRTYATTLAAGMLPTYNGVAPAGDVGFLGAFTGATPTTTAEAVTNFSDIIKAWFLTGTATLAVTPFTPVTWT